MKLEKQNKEYITLYCRECENNDCKYSPIGGYLSQNSKKGCVREVDEDTAAHFFYYFFEDLPFWKNQSERYVINRSNEILNFLVNNIYNAPCANLLDKNGQIKNL